MQQSRDETINKIHDLKIRLVDLAALADVLPGRVTEFVRNRPLPPHQVERIEKSVRDIERVWTAFAPYRIETSDARVFRQAIRDLDAGRLVGIHARAGNGD